MSAPLLAIRGLVKNYQSLRPLRIRELVVMPGQVLHLTGFDAAAAEIFVHLVTGAALPDEGDITLFGTNTREITDADAWLRSLDGLGLVSHRAVLIDALSVLQNLAMPLTLDVDPIDPAVRRRWKRSRARPASTRRSGTGRWPRRRRNQPPVRLGRAVAPAPTIWSSPSTLGVVAEGGGGRCGRRRRARRGGAPGRAPHAHRGCRVGRGDWRRRADPEPASGELASSAGFMERFKRLIGGR